jgi:hypothetical protein
MEYLLNNVMMETILAEMAALMYVILNLVGAASMYSSISYWRFLPSNQFAL